MTDILVLYYSRGGSTARMARAVARGVESSGATARLRTVPPVAPETETATLAVPESGSPYATLDDLRECQGLVLGSPTRFGNMAAPLKYFLDTSGELWINGTLNGRPAGVFTSTGSLHGGQELTLMTMMIPLMHHGMILVGMDSMAPALNSTRAGGTPYGASHWAGGGAKPNVLEPDEMALCESLGDRVARLAARLA